MLHPAGVNIYADKKNRQQKKLGNFQILPVEGY
jgi:hypothetical protein